MHSTKGSYGSRDQSCEEAYFGANTKACLIYSCTLWPCFHSTKRRFCFLIVMIIGISLKESEQPHNFPNEWDNVQLPQSSAGKHTYWTYLVYQYIHKLLLHSASVRVLLVGARVLFDTLPFINFVTGELELHMHLLLMYCTVFIPAIMKLHHKPQ